MECAVVINEAAHY